MERYINQLLEDLAEAEANPTPEPDFGTSYEEFEKVMLEIEEGRKMEAKKIVNVSYEELPPVERLNQKQIQKLLVAIFNALSAKGTNICLPSENAPVELVYREVREHFKEGFNALPGWVIDFCSGYCPDCAFVDYCNTREETWTKEEMEEERRKCKDM
ncbi:MAG: hypothetical protein PHZ24_04910 [Bacteroidales bacterium]|jgi:hypothetical protein|nr:hypothetical protein [Bacteroidales bacterium]